MAALRKKLEDLRELRELVRQLGRGGGKGPLKKAPEQVRGGAELVGGAGTRHGVVRGGAGRSGLPGRGGQGGRKQARGGEPSCPPPLLLRAAWAVHPPDAPLPCPLLLPTSGQPTAAQVYASKFPPGVIRSPLQPEETRGLTRSGAPPRLVGQYTAPDPAAGSSAVTILCRCLDRLAVACPWPPRAASWHGPCAGPLLALFPRAYRMRLLLPPGPAGDLSRMLPFEAHLLAAGWPRWEDAAPGNGDKEGGEGGASSSSAGSSSGGGGGGGGGERVMAREGSRAARMLFMARRCGRTGWTVEQFCTRMRSPQPPRLA